MKVIPIQAVGGLSNTTKMPGKSFGTPTAECKTGSKLRKLEGSVCSKCYACKGRYAMFPKIREAQYRRLDAFKADPKAWVENMVKALDNERWFRWFDSGDLQSVKMLEDIFEVCRRTPWCNHWLATRERSFVRQTLINSEVPGNLVIRVSATFADVPVKELGLEGVNYSNVHKNSPPQGYACPASLQNGKCDTCRACWSKDVKTVSYKHH